MAALSAYSRVPSASGATAPPAPLAATSAPTSCAACRGVRAARSAGRGPGRSVCSRVYPHPEVPATGANILAARMPLLAGSGPSLPVRPAMGGTTTGASARGGVGPLPAVDASSTRSRAAARASARRARLSKSRPRALASARGRGAGRAGRRARKSGKRPAQLGQPGRRHSSPLAGAGAEIAGPEGVDQRLIRQVAARLDGPLRPERARPAPAPSRRARRASRVLPTPHLPALYDHRCAWPWWAARGHRPRPVPHAPARDRRAARSPARLEVPPWGRRSEAARRGFAPPARSSRAPARRGARGRGWPGRRRRPAARRRGRRGRSGSASGGGGRPRPTDRASPSAWPSPTRRRWRWPRNPAG